MTAHHSVGAGSDDEFDAWLAIRYTALADDLAVILNLEAGLAEALQATHFTALAADLTEVLDLDTGLRTIVGRAAPDTADSTAPALPDEEERHHRSWTTFLAAQLELLDAPQRLSLRSHRRYVQLGDSIQLSVDLDHVRARVLDLVRDLDCLVPDVDRNFELGLTCNHVLERARERDYGFDLTGDRALTSVLDRALNQDRVRVHDLTRALDRALDHDRVRDLTCALDLTRALDRALAYDRNLNRDVDLARALVLAHDLASDLTRVPVRERARVLDLTRALESDHYFIQDFDLNRAFAVALDLTRALASALEGALGRAFDCARAVAADRAANLAYIINFGLGIRLWNVHSADVEALKLLGEVLDRVATDFVGADLRSASLADAFLEGVRWSDDTHRPPTRWPPEYEEPIRAASVEIEPGVFEIRGRLELFDRSTIMT